MIPDLIRNTVYYSILRSEWETIKEQYFSNFIMYE